MYSLNRQLQCESVKIYRAQTPYYLALTKISVKRAHPCLPLTSQFSRAIKLQYAFCVKQQFSLSSALLMSLLHYSNYTL